jgi:hypothetical protein
MTAHHGSIAQPRDYLVGPSGVHTARSVEVQGEGRERPAVKVSFWSGTTPMTVSFTAARREG